MKKALETNKIENRDHPNTKKMSGERWLVLASIIGFLFLVGSTFFLDSLSSSIQWVEVGKDSQGNDYSVDQHWTLKALKSQDDSANLNQHPYAVRVGYADESRMVKGFKIKAVLEQGHINCVNSTVKATKWMFLDVSESPIRLEKKQNQKGVLEEPDIQKQVINFVCALKNE